MKLGIQSLQFLSDPQQSLADQFEAAVPALREADRLRFDWVSASQHWISSPTVWPQPFPVLASLAPLLERMRLMTQMLILPLHNPVDVAEQVATLDQLSRGRLILGMAIGYRDVELRAAGMERKDRVGRMEEGITLLRRLWSGERVVFHGRWTVVDEGQMGFGCYQDPHPPLVLAAQSEAATKRAAQLGDGVFFGPQIRYGDLTSLVRLYKEACAEVGRPLGIIGAGRSVMLGDTREAAVASARDYSERTMKTYGSWDMQELGMVSLQLERHDFDEWAIVGSTADCVEKIEEINEEVGLTHITLTAYNLPTSAAARLEYVQRLGEEVVTPVKRSMDPVSSE